MAKKISRLELVLPPRELGTPAGRWLHEAIRGLILEGRLRPRAWLPSTRDLARQYGLARGTVVDAFEELKWEGYLEARVGAGTRVSPTLPDSLLEVARPERQQPRLGQTRSRPISRYGERVRSLGNLEAGPVRAFRANQPALDLFPLKQWAQIVGRRLKTTSTDLWLSCDPLGFLPLREAVAEYLATSRGVTCAIDQIAIVSGVQEGLDLAGRLFLNPGDRVAMETPGYDGARRVFEALGATVVEVPVDEEGMRFDPTSLEGSRLVYVTPAHQYPLGVAMSLARRLALLEWAADSEAVIFEDDYDSEYRYSGRPLPALQGLDRKGQVVFAGTFSKVLLPSLRLGYLVLPDDLVDRFAAVQSITRRHAPVLEQAALADFMAGGHFGRHIRRMRQVYAHRLAVLLEGAEQRLAGLLEISGVEAGLQTVGWLHEGLDGKRAAEAAARRHVEVFPILGHHSKGPSWDGLHLGFAAVDATEIRRGIHDLAIALEEAAGRKE